MGILEIILMALGVVNTAIGTMGSAEKAFSGKRGSGKAKRKLVMEAAKAMADASKLTPAQKKLLLTQTGKTVDTVAKATKTINALK